MHNIFEILRAYKIAIFRRWWLWLLLSIICTSIMVGVSLNKPTFYDVRTTFLPEAQSGVANPLAALLSGGGIDAGAGLAGNNMMVGVLLSTRIHRAIAQDRITYKGKEVKATTQFLKSWPISEDMLTKVGLSKRRPLKDTVAYITSTLKGSIKVTPDGYGYLEVIVSLPDDELAKAVSLELIEQVGIYYRTQKTEKARYSLNYFEQKIDSVKSQLDAATYANAHYVDRYKFSPQAASFIPREQATIKASYLQGIYGQLLVSREQAIAQLLDETPIIQVLDYPELAKIKAPKLWLAAMIGLLGGAFLAALVNAWSKARADITAYVASLIEQEVTNE